MEKVDLEFIAKYAQRLNAHEGDLTVLNIDEREHLATLLRLHKLEQKTREMAAKLGQGLLL